MVEQITKLIEQVSAKEISGSAISSDLTSAVTKETGDSIINGFKNSISSGNISGLTDLLSGGVSNLTSNPMVSGMIGNLISGLTTKLGLPEGVASNFADTVIPSVIEMIVSKVQGGESGFQLTDLIGGLSDGNGGGINDMLGSLTGGKEGLGGAMDALKGLF